MRFRSTWLPVGVIAVAALAAVTLPELAGQGHDHAAHAGRAAADRPTEAGQAAFAAIKEMVTLLEQDPATDWSRVDLDALRDHLVDMNRVVIHAEVRKTNVPGGAEFQVSGEGAVIGAIQRMVVSHGAMVGAAGELAVQTTRTATGVQLQLTAPSGDGKAVERIRALGFAGFLALGDHHQPHHEMIARGRGAEAHRH